MKKIIMIALMLISIAALMAKTTQLKDFDALMDALKKGEQVRVVINYGECQLINGNEIKEKVPDAIGGMNIDTFEYFAPMAVGNPEGFVAFSHSSLINLGGFIYNYGKFKITEDGKVKMTAQYAIPGTFDIEMDENFFTDINDGKNEGACFFYLVN